MDKEKLKIVMEHVENVCHILELKKGIKAVLLRNVRETKLYHGQAHVSIVEMTKNQPQVENNV